MRRRVWLALLLWLAVGAACRAVGAPTAPAEPRPIGNPTAERAAASTAAAPTPPASIPPTRSPQTSTSPLTTPTEVPTPVPTPQHPRILAVVPSFPLAALLRLEQAPALTGWTVRRVPDPEAALRSGAADLALVNGRQGRHHISHPLAVTVPWSEPWRALTTAEALALRDRPEQATDLVLELWPPADVGRRVLRPDGRHPSDPDYPLLQEWSLLGSQGSPTAPTAAELAALTAAAQAALIPPGLVRLAAVGDVMLDRSLGAALQRGVDPADPAFPFYYVLDRLRAADYTVGNLESALGTVGTPAPKRYTFRAPPAAAEALAVAGFDLVALANNHALDYGADGLLEGMALLAAQGVATAGAGRTAAEARAPHLVVVNGLRLAFLAYAHVPVEVGGFDTASWRATADQPGLAWADPAEVAADVQAARATADHVIVLLHSGYEYQTTPSPPQAAAAQAAVAAGAALVIGSHAHVLQGVAFVDGRVIAYGLGNFAFEIDGDPRSVIMQVWLDAGGVRDVSFWPVRLAPGGQPRPVGPAESAAILDYLYRLRP